MSQYLVLTIPIKTISEANQRGITRLAAIFKAKRIKTQRSETYYSLLGTYGRPTPIILERQLVVVLTRIAPRALDQGNLEASFKAVQDGVADWLAGEYGKGQDRQEGLCWQYTQQRGKPGEHAVVVTIHRDA